MLACLQEYPNLFPGIEDAFKAEAYLRQEAARPQPAARYPEVQGQHMQDILSRVADLNINGGSASAGDAGGGGATPPAANGAASAFVPAPVADLLGLGREDEEEAFGDAEAEPEEEGQPHVAEEAFGFGEAEVEAEHEAEEAEAEAEEDVFADAAAPPVQFEPERPAELAYAAPVSPPYAAAGPADVPAATASGLTAEEEALLAEDEDDDLLGGDLGVDDADLNDAGEALRLGRALRLL